MKLTNALWLLFVMFGLMAPLVDAATTESELAGMVDQSASPGIDVVVLLDQSGSMAGIGVPQASDPDNRRIYTTRYLIDYLVFDNLYVNANRVNRVAVIGFGDTADILVPLTALNDKAIADEAKERVKPKEMGETNVVAALEKVREVLPTNSDSETAEYGGFRRRMLILITDGAPNICGDEKYVSYSAAFACIETAYDGTLNLRQTMPLYVIGIQESEQGWQTVLPFWEEFSLYVERAENIDEVNRAIVEQVCLFANSENDTTTCQLQNIGPHSHFIQPYAKTASFSFFKYQENASITLKHPDDRKVSVAPPDADLLDFLSTPRDELYVIESPEFGCWTSERKGAGKVDVFTQVVFNDLTIVKPTATHPQALPLKFEFELRDPDGKYISEDPALPIVFNASLIAPDGSAQAPQEVKIAKVADGRYASTASSTPNLPVPGNYELRVEGQVDIPAQSCLPAGQEVTVFKGNYQIPVYAPRLSFEPAQPHLQYSPIKGFAVSFLDSNGRALALPAEMPEELALAAQAPGGQIVDLPTAMLDGNKYRFPSAIILPETGRYTVFANLKDTAGKIRYSGQGQWEQAINVYVPIPGANFPMGSPLNEVEARLLDLNGQPVEPDLDYPLRLEMALSNSTTETQTAFLQPIKGNASVYTSSVKWSLDAVSLYQLQVTGYLSDPNGGGEAKAFTTTRNITVSQTLPFFVVTEPEAQQEYNLYLGPIPWRMPQQVRVELRLVNDSPKFADLLTGDPNDMATVSVVGPDGAVMVDARLLLLESDGRSLAAELPELTASGAYTATVSFNAKPRNGEPSEGAWPPITVRFTRAVPTWVRILWWALGLVVAAVAGTVGILQLNNFVLRPKLTGTLYFEAGPKGPLARNDGSLLVVSLAPLKRHRARISGKQLNCADVADIKHIEVKRIDFPPPPGPPSAAPGRSKQPTPGVEMRVIFNDLTETGGKLKMGGPSFARPKLMGAVSKKLYQIRHDM